jgi:multidrug resistance efflux pump
MIDPVVTAAALASAEANVATIEARAVALAGTPSEPDIQIIAAAARRIARNLRTLLDTAERRTT